MTSTTKWLVRVLGCAAIVTCGMVASAGAQDARLEGRVPEAVRTEVDVIVEGARAAGLPTEALIDRALEGASKGADGTRIVAAVRRLRDELGMARDAMGSASTAAELVAGASALRAGASADHLNLLRSQRADEPLTVAAAVLADLVAVGVPVDTAVTAVLALAEGANDTEFIAFRRNVERDIALGASPVAALGVRLDLAAEVFTTDRAPPPSPRKP
jgi:hypothetical protein